MYFYKNHIFALTGCLAPHAEHFIVVILSSFFNWVSGFLHSGHNTNSSVYCFIFSFIKEEGNFLPRINLGPSIIAGVANSLCKYFNTCWGSLLSVEHIAKKLEITV